MNAAQHYYLDDLIHLPRYEPGKNSFLIQKLRRGETRILLDIKGTGSVRHVWSTWSIPGDDSDVPAPGRVRLRVFVDGETQPSISGRLDDLCHAAEQTGDRFVPLPAFNYKGAFNFYLPIFFNRSIRIEIEALDEIAEFYTQIDYRTGDAPNSARLVSKGNGAGLTLNYSNRSPAWHEGITKITTLHRTPLLGYGEKPAELTIEGPAVIRELTFAGDSLSDLNLQVYWDGEANPSVDAPLKYLFADFNNVAMRSKPGRSTAFFPMPFRKKARLVIHGASGKQGRVRVEYVLEPGNLSAQTLYFHAQYHETPNTTGYAQHPVLQAQGEGLFVGMNLFDSGHNHGGGDAALIDAGSAYPRVLHGICGEDYFGFAWHHFGSMTPLTGAPAHERRYRLHLENPYPFRQSIQFLFGVFAGQYPKSVAFWYQRSSVSPQTEWSTVDIPWKILGPATLDASLPSSVTNETYPTTLALNQPTNVEEHWQDVVMRLGFLDATYQFRHYAMIEKGTGFVAGAGKTRMITHVYAPSARNVRTVLGHDDRVTVALNGERLIDVAPQNGFGASDVTLRLRAGWNKLDFIVYNDENVNWRWAGLSLAFDRQHVTDLKFAAQVPTR